MTTNVALPAVRFPTVTRIFSKRFGMAGDGPEEPILWDVGALHPLVPHLKIIRMFIVDSGSVEVYSLMPDGKNGMRETIPRDQVLLIQEIMPASVFLDELVAAESDDDSDDDDDQDEDDEYNDEGEDKPIVRPEPRLQAVNTDPIPEGGQGEPS